MAREILGDLPEPRRALLANFLDARGDCIDRGLALYFPEPGSFTGEHVLELRPLSEAEHRIWHPATERFFTAPLRMTRRVTDICLFTQSGPRAPFVVTERIALRG